MSIEEIEQKLIDYFTDTVQGSMGYSEVLKILDTPSSNAAARGGYTGVTIPYLKEHVLKENVPDPILFFVLGKMKQKNILYPFYCGNINNLVIENYDIGHDKSNRIIDLALNTYVNKSTS